jgi:hypothetical protein
MFPNEHGVFPTDSSHDAKRDFSMNMVKIEGYPNSPKRLIESGLVSVVVFPILKIPWLRHRGLWTFQPLVAYMGRKPSSPRRRHRVEGIDVHGNTRETRKLLFSRRELHR